MRTKTRTYDKMKVSLIALSVTAMLGMSSIASAVITGSAHDFSTKGWNSTGEICIVCHTPHEADITVIGAPLWNHEVSVQTYIPYASVTLTATDVAQPSGTSKLCLSCHDGTIAVDNFGGVTNGTSFLTGKKNIGVDLSDDHPISFTYDATLATTDGGLYDPTTTLSGLVGGGTITDDLLFGGTVRCASCHDVHNSFNNNKLLVIPNTGSDLCLTCHNK